MNKNILEKIFEILKKYEKKESAIIEILHFVQKEKRFISDDDLDNISKITGIPYSQLKSVKTFYTMFSKNKIGKYHIQICKNISCYMKGSQNIKRHIEDKLKIKEGEVSNDGLWSIEMVECLASCGTAPVIMINETYYENIDEEKINKLIEEIKKKEETK
ncbi:MAG: NADH-quinone oxidoreductase subunit NuoE [Elusimicrobiales bacterium]|nr:NADH-quinone oxidoreductase subunit NuoE [Elusimicrobiales bacterium]